MGKAYLTKSGGGVSTTDIHNHDASDITSGILPIKRGGTGAGDAASARAALGITPENIGARPNTWLPTIAEIGAAPAGHGLGGDSQYTKVDNLDDLKSNGWYCVELNNILYIGSFDVQYCSVEVTNYTGAILVKQVMTPVDSQRTFERFCVRGEWQPWIEASPSAFAPAGYGLGEICKSIDSWNNAIKGGLYSSNVDAPDTKMWWGCTIPYNETNAAQIAFRRENGKLVECVRNSDDGTWSEWEWENPPMVPGVEYRTTERWHGNVVYTKLISLGSVGAGFSSFTDGVSFGTRVIRFAATHNGEGIPVPGCGGQTSAYAKEIVVAPNAVSFYGANLVTSAHLYVQAWYGKE